MKEEEQYYHTSLSNTYGSVHIYKKDGKFMIALDDYASTDEKEISKELFELIRKELTDEEN